MGAVIIYGNESLTQNFVDIKTSGDAHDSAGSRAEMAAVTSEHAMPHGGELMRGVFGQ
jgi:hypothetical protein